MPTKKREHWSSHLGFLMAAAGSAIGLGTLWRFPYVVGQNGGGLFVLIYWGCLLLIGIPLFITELILGREADRGAVGIFAKLTPKKPFWKVAGWLGVLAAFLIMSFYSIIAGWGLHYVMLSLRQIVDPLPSSEIAAQFDAVSGSFGITLFWHAIYTLLTCAIVAVGIQKGIEFWSKLMTSSLFILLLILFAFATTLDGFSDAVHFLFAPDFTEVNPSSCLQALGLSLFTLSLGHGIMLTYGSYMGKEENIPKTSFTVALMILIVSLLSGLTLFSITFTFGIAADSGPGLVFQTMPYLFSKLPGSSLLSLLFFTLFTFTAITSTIAMVEVIVANGIDLYNWRRAPAAYSIGLCTFLVGIPSLLSLTNPSSMTELFGQSIFEIVNDLVSLWLLPLGALLIAIYAGYIYSKEALQKQFLLGSNWKPGYFCWNLLIRYIAPLGMIIILLQSFWKSLL